MNKQTVGYSESHESFNPATGLKSWKKIWYEEEINEDQDPTEAFNQAKALVNSWGSNGQEAYQLGPSDPSYIGIATLATGTIPHVQPPIRNLAAERLEILIEKTDSIGELKVYESDAIKYGLQSAYDNKLKSLQ